VNPDIKTLSIDQLKSIKCDAYEAIQLQQNNIAIINNELHRRQTEQVAVTTPIVPEVVPTCATRTLI
jgi:hypothetical protein